MMMQKKTEPVLTTELFPEIFEELLMLLSSLTVEEWHRPTTCAGWSVKDVALHLLGGEVGNLSRRRDGVVTSASISSWDELVIFINEWNQEWVRVTQRVSPQLLIDLLSLTGRQMCAYFEGLDPFALGDSVSWAGPEPAPVWLDLAREYTERWHHQQHIRDAVGRPGLKQPRYFAPVLGAFMHALPYTYREVNAAQGTCVTVTLTGESGGRWTVQRAGESWRLFSGAPEQPDAEVVIDQDLAWRLFTRGVSEGEAREQITVKGSQSLGFKVLGMVSIIA
ncbi:MAG: maleylpyruvate isomerase family mycothiol-dependent enzyme [Anaerolineaceae bacterium]|nr:maleylpyruvate isomerase family mycothiol-dependent enzyme [Anaerolineaceae bacterium]